MRRQRVRDGGVAEDSVYVDIGDGVIVRRDPQWHTLLLIVWETIPVFTSVSAVVREYLPRVVSARVIFGVSAVAVVKGAAVLGVSVLVVIDAVVVGAGGAAFVGRAIVGVAVVGAAVVGAAVVGAASLRQLCGVEGLTWVLPGYSGDVNVPGFAVNVDVQAMTRFECMVHAMPLGVHRDRRCSFRGPQT